MIETQEQALAEARKRWGLKAQAWISVIDEQFIVTNKLGYRGRKLKGQIFGRSYDSWDAAFADADKREGK